MRKAELLLQGSLLIGLGAFAGFFFKIFITAPILVVFVILIIKLDRKEQATNNSAYFFVAMALAAFTIGLVAGIVSWQIHSGLLQEVWKWMSPVFGRILRS